MKEQHLNIAQFGIGKRDQNYLHPSTPLHVECDHLVPNQNLDQQTKDQEYLKNMLVK